MTSKWENLRLGEVAETSKISGESVGAENYVGLEHLKTRSSKIQGSIPVSEVSSATTGFRAGDVLFGRLRPYLHKVANATYSGCCTNEILVWRPRNIDTLLPGFLSLILQKDSTIAYATSMSAGSRMPRVTAKSMSEMSTLVPPLAEQRRIVDLIGALDDAIEAAEMRLNTAKRALERMQGRDIPGDPTFIGEVLQGIDNGVTMKAKELSDGALGQRIVKASGVLPARFVESETKPVGDFDLPSHAKISIGDLLMTRINTPERVGHICRVRNLSAPTFRPDLVWRLRLDESKILPDFFEHRMASRFMRNRVSEAASGTSRSMQQISKGRFSKVILTIPTLELQTKYIEECNAMREAVQRLENHLASLRDLRTELLTALLSGAHEIPESYDSVMELAGV